MKEVKKLFLDKGEEGREGPFILDKDLGNGAFTMKPTYPCKITITYPGKTKVIINLDNTGSPYVINYQGETKILSNSEFEFFAEEGITMNEILKNIEGTENITGIRIIRIPCEVSNIEFN